MFRVIQKVKIKATFLHKKENENML